MASNGTGFDLWDVEALLLSGRKKGAAFQVTRFARFDYDGSRVVTGAGDSLGDVCLGLTGRDLILKYPRVPTVPDWQLAKLMDFEVEGIAQQAGGKLSYDYNLLPVQNEMTGEDTVLLALAKSESLDATIRLVEQAKGSVAAFTPNAVAAYNCYLQFGQLSDAVTLVAWIGETSIDLALVRGQNLLFARNVAGGLATLGAAISQAFNVRDERARKIRRELLDLDPGKRGQYGKSQEEKVAHAVQGVQGQLQAALRSTLAFCQSQIQIQDLSLDRVLLCGPGAKVRGMDRFLASGLGAPVEVWNPVHGCDLSQCPPEDAAALEEAGPEAVIALGLALAPCFDDLYSVEILPEAVKKKRQFQQRTIFNIGAALVAALFLLVTFVRSKAQHEDLAQKANVAESQQRRYSSTHKSTEKLVEEYEAAAVKLKELEELAVPLHGAVRTLRILRTKLPENLWVKELRSIREKPTWDPSIEEESSSGLRRRNQRSLQRPLILIHGHAVPLGSERPVASFGRFKSLLDAAVPYVEPSVPSTPLFTFSCTLDFLFKPPQPDPQQDPK